MNDFNKYFSINIQQLSKMIDFEENNNDLELTNSFDDYSFNIILTENSTEHIILSKYVGNEQEAIIFAKYLYQKYKESKDLNIFKEIIKQ